MNAFNHFIHSKEIQKKKNNTNDDHLNKIYHFNTKDQRHTAIPIDKLT